MWKGHLERQNYRGLQRKTKITINSLHCNYQLNDVYITVIKTFKRDPEVTLHKQTEVILNILRLIK